jgi:hypothetical protein
VLTSRILTGRSLPSAIRSQCRAGARSTPQEASVLPIPASCATTRSMGTYQAICSVHEI